MTSVQKQLTTLQESVEVLTQIVLSLQPPDGRKDPMERISMGEAAKETGVHYQTLRTWVVKDKKIPFSRLGDSPKGDIRLIRRDVLNFIAGRKPGTKATSKKAKAKRATNQVNIL